MVSVLFESERNIYSLTRTTETCSRWKFYRNSEEKKNTSISCAHVQTHTYRRTQSIYKYTHSSTVVGFMSAGSRKAAPPFSPSHPSLPLSLSSPSPSPTLPLALSLCLSCSLCNSLFLPLLLPVNRLSFCLLKREDPFADFLHSLLSSNLLSVSLPHKLSLSLSIGSKHTVVSLVFHMHLPRVEGNRDLTRPSSSPPPLPPPHPLPPLRSSSHLLTAGSCSTSSW